MEECIFCKIINGEIPSFKIHEDNEIVAFLDVMPRSEGMCIVVPKKHYSHFNEDMDTSSKVFDMALMVGEKIRASLNPLAVFFSSMEAQVPHFHARVYPVYQDVIPLIENKPIDLGGIIINAWRPSFAGGVLVGITFHVDDTEGMNYLLDNKYGDDEHLNGVWGSQTGTEYMVFYENGGWYEYKCLWYYDSVLRTVSENYEYKEEKRLEDKYKNCKI